MTISSPNPGRWRWWWNRILQTGGFFIRQADGVLDPGRYFGFYELDGNSGQSIVHWNNLQPEPAEAENKGAESDE